MSPLKIIAGIFAVIVAAILLLQIDDDLNPEIAPFLAKGAATTPNDAYFYLMGIDAPADENPLEYGKKKYAAINQEKPDSDTGTLPEVPIPTDTLILPEDEYLSYGGYSLSAVFSVDDIAKVLSNNAVLLERYQTFIKMKGYQTVTKPTISEETPHYAYLTKGNRLLILKAINTAKTSGAAKAIPLLTGNLSALRYQLESADNLIGKMIYTFLISESLDTLSIIAHQQKSFSAVKIAPISLAERNLETAMSRELSMASDIFQIDKNLEVYAGKPRWMVRTVIKPNMSINAEYVFYKGIAARSQLEQTEFTAVIHDVLKQHIEQESQISLRNSAGSILVNVAKPNFEQYIARLLDLNAKIAIFNQTANKAELPTDLSDIHNPYYGKAGTAYYSEDKKSICLTGPLDNDSGPCLRVRL